MKWDIPYDSSKFVNISISRVVETLIEAMIFRPGDDPALQDFRYTLIPAIAVPVALFGAFGVMSAFGFSINVLTMFAMVLAVGILALMPNEVRISRF